MSLPELSRSDAAGRGAALFAGALKSSSAELPKIPHATAAGSPVDSRRRREQPPTRMVGGGDGRPPMNVSSVNSSHSIHSISGGHSALMTMGGITAGSSLLHSSHSQLNGGSRSSAGALPPGWSVAKHSVNGKKYFYNENSKEATWNRPAFPRDKQDLYQLRPEHRSLLDEQPSSKLESLPSTDGYIKPSDISNALESVTMSELELATKLRTIGPGLYLAKVMLERTRSWFVRWSKWTTVTIEAREKKYLFDVIMCQSVCRGWLTRGKAERYRQLLWRQSRMKIGEIRKEIVNFVTTVSRKEKEWEKGDFKRWFERWKDKQYDFHFEEIIGYKRMLALEKAKNKKNKKKRR